eukprot:691089-Pyramimonas_sp.AAC.1
MRETVQQRGRRSRQRRGELAGIRVVWATRWMLRATMWMLRVRRPQAPTKSGEVICEGRKRSGQHAAYNNDGAIQVSLE